MNTDKKPITAYNKKQVFQTQIAPHLQAIKELCVINEVPFISCFAIANDEKKTSYVYDGTMPGMYNIDLTDKTINKHLLVANGFDVRPRGGVGVMDDIVKEATRLFSQLEPMQDEIQEE